VSRGQLLGVNSIDVSYGRTPVLRGVTLDLGSGEAVCVIGRNGAGKTTLLRALMGVLPVREGEVRLLGHDVTKWKGNRRARLGLSWVPQGSSVFPGLSVEEHLKIAARMAKGNKTNEEVMELFPVLSERLSQEAQTLSGGERKMLAIAQALISGPKVMLLDEPTEGIAPVIVAQIRAALARLVDVCSIVLVEQNVDTALAVGTRAYVLERGAVVEQGNMRELHESGIIRKRLGL
jgi:ABC-type branched-subunit amino acid transport system ATPase component